MNETVQQIHAVLSATADRWHALLSNLPQTLLQRAPAPGEWSALDCLQHLLDTESMVFPVRVHAFLEGRDFDDFDPDAQGAIQASDQSPAECLAAFAEHRARSLDLLRQLSAADLQRTARHSELGIVTLSELLHEWAGHDLMHMVQAEQALMQPFIQGCGPWRSYFAAHEQKES